MLLNEYSHFTTQIKFESLSIIRDFPCFYAHTTANMLDAYKNVFMYTRWLFVSFAFFSLFLFGVCVVAWSSFGRSMGSHFFVLFGLLSVENHWKGFNYVILLQLVFIHQCIAIEMYANAWARNKMNIELNFAMSLTHIHTSIDMETKHKETFDSTARNGEIQLGKLEDLINLIIASMSAVITTKHHLTEREPCIEYTRYGCLHACNLDGAGICHSNFKYSITLINVWCSFLCCAVYSDDSCHHHCVHFSCVVSATDLRMPI